MQDFTNLLESMIDQCLEKKLKSSPLNELLLSEDEKVTKLNKEFSEIRVQLDSLMKYCSQIESPSETFIDGRSVYDPKAKILKVIGPIQKVYSFSKTNSNRSSFHNCKNINKYSEKRKDHSSLLKENTKISSPLSDQNLVTNPISTNDSTDHKPNTTEVTQKLSVRDTVFACNSKATTLGIQWKKAVVQSISKVGKLFLFDVNFLNSNQKVTLRGQRIAFLDSPQFILKVGTRVIGLYKLDKKEVFIAGIVAEPPKETNKFRYLIFFDLENDTSAYNHPNELHLIAESSCPSWDDSPIEKRPFIKKYITEYPERVMVKFLVNENVHVRIGKEWVIGKVEEVDCSLVKLYFDHNNTTEWFFRGSIRLMPIYQEIAHLLSDIPHFKYLGKKGRVTKSSLHSKKKSYPYVQYTRESDNEDARQSDLQGQPNFVQEVNRIQRARKSSSKPSGSTSAGIVSNLQTSKKSSKKFEVSLIRKPKILLAPKAYVSHECSKYCVPNIQDYLKKYCNENPFVIPIILGWNREVCSTIPKYSNISEHVNVYYVAPCGKRMRNIDEVDKYLYITDCPLTIDLFTYENDFELYFDVENQTNLQCFYFVNDISKGIENQPISCINTLNDERLSEDFKYIKNRIPGKGVKIPCDKEFLASCDCIDNCRNKFFCKCQQLTSEAAEIIKFPNDLFSGYHHKRLNNLSVTGIYECNSNCTCNETCRNKVVQQGIKVKLQIFKTTNKGWGVRCLHKIPKGTFICTYAAEVFTDIVARKDQHLYANEDLTDLDYIDVMEEMKEHYESAVEEEISSDETSNDEITENKRKRESRHKEKKIKLEEKKPLKSYKAVREIFNETFLYTLDAKIYANIGKFLNHSCSPNCFVRNIFVDTHDLRFPWISFFAAESIPAFSELTWNYNYEIGSIPGKKLSCYCLSSQCKKRLL